jgi:hypothetical protein
VGSHFQEKYENAAQVNGELKELLLLLKVHDYIQFNQSSQFAPQQSYVSFW